MIRSRVRHVQRDFDRLAPDEQKAREAELVARLDSGPVTILTDTVNRQHYELPARFFQMVLGPQLKYSCCHWEPGETRLAAAEESMLRLTAQRADLQDGQEVLDLGCGWGSFSLWVAERHRRSRVTAVSNSCSQAEFIAHRAQERGLHNLHVVTADVADFRPMHRFDRIVSVEMFEHVRNHRLLMQRLAEWLEPEGRLFIHIFCHRRHLYAFEPGKKAWMERYFFSGGVMPSWDYLTRYQDPLRLQDRWEVAGHHYVQTLRAWLRNLDRRREQVMPVLEEVYGVDQARLWLARWRIFFVACEETFALDEGRSYFVGHYRFARLDSAPRRR